MGSEYSAADVRRLHAENYRLRIENTALRTDADRIDWLADVNNTVGSVVLPRHIVEQNISSLRQAIDAARSAKTPPGDCAMTDCECGHQTLFTRTGRVLCSHTASKAQALGIMPADWLPLSMDRPHPPTRNCLCPDCWPSFYDTEWMQP